MRSGTQNIAGILGCAAAVEHAVAFQPAFAERAAKLRDSLYQELCSLPKVSATVRLESGEFAPHIVNVCVSGMESQTMILQLDLRGFCVSGGSACSSNSLDPSHVLSALGVKRNLAQGSLRISFGEITDEADVASFVEAFKEVVS